MRALALRPLFAAALLTCLHASALAQFGLLPRAGGPEVPLSSHHAQVHWEDGIATTTLRQVFQHEGARPLEAVYLFPLPEGARLTGLAMETGGLRLEGFLAERQQARRTYDSLVRRAIDPALVEQIGRSSFRLSVFPVLPQQPTVVELRWIEEAPLLDGVATLVHAMTREHPPAKAVDVVYELSARSSAPLQFLKSDDPDLAISRVSEYEARGSLERQQQDGFADLVVRLGVASAEPRLHVHVHRPPGEPAYFAAILTPPDLPAEQTLPRDITLALDVSGSMKGQKLQQAIEAGRALVEQTRPRDRVNVVLFSDSTRRFAETPVPLDDQTRAALLAFLNAAHAAGGTNLEGALRTICAMPKEAGRVAIAAVLTDGIPTVGEKKPEELVLRAREGAARGLRVFPFGVGPDVEGSLLEAVAEAGGGRAEIFRPGGEIASRLRRFLLRTSSPALSDLRLEIDGRQVDDLQPSPLPAVCLGEQAILTGRWPAAGTARLELRGVLSGEDFTLTREVDFGAASDTLAQGASLARDLYARQRLELYERTVRLREKLSDAAFYAAVDRGAYSTRDELIEAAIKVSLDSGLQCAYTSFLALLPEDRARLQGASAAALQEAMQRASDRREALRTGATGQHEGAAQTGAAAPIMELDSGSASNNSTDRVDLAPMPVDAELSPPPPPIDSPFDSRNLNDVIGAGGGAGGGFGGKYGRRGSGSITQKAVSSSDSWLLRQQSPDDLWHEEALAGDSAQAQAVSSVRASGLALLCFLGEGSTPVSGEHRGPIKRGLRALCALQQADGSLCSTSDNAGLEAHALATTALIESFTLSGVPQLRRPAEHALQALLAAQREDGSFGHGTPRERELPTAQAMMALATACEDLLTAHDPAVERGLSFLRSRTDPALPQRDPRTCAATLLLSILLEKVPPESPLSGTAQPQTASSGAERQAAAPPADEFTTLRDHVAQSLHEAAARGPVDPVLRHFGSYALWQCGGEYWKNWEAVLLDQVVKTQVSDPSKGHHGSWTVPGGCEEGRIAYSAWSVLCLEVYYRYDHLLIGR